MEVDGLITIFRKAGATDLTLPYYLNGALLLHQRLDTAGGDLRTALDNGGAALALLFAAVNGHAA